MWFRDLWCHIDLWFTNVSYEPVASVRKIEGRKLYSFHTYERRWEYIKVNLWEIILSTETVMNWLGRAASAGLLCSRTVICGLCCRIIKIQLHWLRSRHGDKRQLDAAACVCVCLCSCYLLCWALERLKNYLLRPFCPNIDSAWRHSDTDIRSIQWSVLRPSGQAITLETSAFIVIKLFFHVLLENISRTWIWRTVLVKLGV
jgi:hypothetical protein